MRNKKLLWVIGILMALLLVIYFLNDSRFDIAKNPKSALGGQGMFDIQQKLQKLQSDATQSKQDKAYDYWNRQHLAINPSMATDENKF